MNSVTVVVVLIGLLIVVNGFLAMSEIALVSTRRFRLQRRAKAGETGAKTALTLLDSPTRFLSTIQLGITLVGILAGVLGGADLADELSAALSRWVGANGWAGAISIVVIVGALTYLTMVFGELVPKRVALSNADRIAVFVAPMMSRLARLAFPLVKVLTYSTEAVVRLARVRAPAEPPVTEDEINLMLERGTRLGMFEPAERDMVGRVFRLADRSVAAIMTPHPDVVWLDLDESVEQTRDKLVRSGHAFFPVIRGQRDNVVGIVRAKDLLAECLASRPIAVEPAVRPAQFVPEGAGALELLERFREARGDIALVIDEYGSLVGLVTGSDVLEAIVGELPTVEQGEPEIVRRGDGSWLVDGAVPIDELEDIFGESELPEGRYETVGGLIMAVLGRVPSEGDFFDFRGFRLEVVDMDRRRVDKVLVIPPRSP